MMKAEIHDNKVLGIALKEVKKYARVKHVATAILSDVEFGVSKDVLIRGTLVGTYDNAMDLSDFEVPESIKKRFREVSRNETGKFIDVESQKEVTKARTVYAVSGLYYYLPSK